jgi:hypothetical protein
VRTWGRFAISAAAALLACVVVALWVRSRYVLDELSFADADGRTFAAVSFQGGVHVARSGDQAARRALEWDASSIPDDCDWSAVYRRGQVDWQWMGFARLSGTTFIVPTTLTAAAAPGRTFGGTATVPLVPWLMAPPYVSYVVPYWSMILLLAPPLALAPVGQMKRRWRRRRGRCERCGYDLRASAGRCPECGAGAVGPVAA